MLYAGFILGLLGSLHCIGMCGPIAMILPLSKTNATKKHIQILLYHFGRIITYSLLGALFGLVGKGPGKYNFHLGGDQSGQRIPRMYKENVGFEEILTDLDGFIGQWSAERESGESFGDYVVRANIVKPVIDSARDFYDA